MGLGRRGEREGSLPRTRSNEGDGPVRMCRGNGGSEMAKKWKYFGPTVSIMDLKPLDLKRKGIQVKRDKTGWLMYRKVK